MSMSTEIKRGKLFVGQILAKLKGDDNQELAIKISRKALSAVDSQLASLRAREVDLESAVEDAEESLNNAKFPTTLISDNQSYIKGIQTAQNSLDKAQEDLADTRSSIEYFEKLLKSF